MNRIMLAIATLVFTLVFSAGTLAEPRTVTETAKQIPASQDSVTVTITDKRGKPIKLESLSREDQARVVRAQKAAKKYVDEEPGGGGARVKVTVSGRCCPLEIIIVVSF